MVTKAYIYVRMSTEQQSHGDSLPRQTERAEAFCRTHGLEIDRELDLRDIGVSAFTGANVESGALGRFLAAIKEHRVPPGSYLLIESHDRLSRMEPAKALPIFLEIQSAGISIAVLADTGHPRPSPSHQNHPLSTGANLCNNLSLRLVQNIGQVNGLRLQLTQSGSRHNIGGVGRIFTTRRVHF